MPVMEISQASIFESLGAFRLFVSGWMPADTGHVQNAAHADKFITPGDGRLCLVCLRSVAFLILLYFPVVFSDSLLGLYFSPQATPLQGSKCEATIFDWLWTSLILNWYFLYTVIS